VIFGVLRHHGGRIAEENLARSPVGEFGSGGATRRERLRDLRGGCRGIAHWPIRDCSYGGAGLTIYTVVHKRWRVIICDRCNPPITGGRHYGG
jgi:hypothetical protein